MPENSTLYVEVVACDPPLVYNTGRLTDSIIAQYRNSNKFRMASDASIKALRSKIEYNDVANGDWSSLASLARAQKYGLDLASYMEWNEKGDYSGKVDDEGADSEGMKLPEVAAGETLYIGYGTLPDVGFTKIAMVLSADKKSVHGIAIYLKEFADTVGGVDIDLSMEEIYFMESKIRGVTSETHTNYEDNAISVDEAGLLTLNGVQAAAYCRIRPADGGYDAGRTERTRNVISQVLTKAFKLPAAEMLQFANVFFEKMRTNIPDDVFLTLAMNASDLRQYTLISDRIPIDGSYESGDTGSGYYVTPDYEVNKKHLQDSLYKGIHE